MRGEVKVVLCHLDDQQQAGKFLGSDVLVMGGLDGLIGASSLDSLRYPCPSCLDDVRFVACVIAHVMLTVPLGAVASIAEPTA